jgi:hypothetical protein
MIPVCRRRLRGRHSEGRALGPNVIRASRGCRYFAVERAPQGVVQLIVRGGWRAPLQGVIDIAPRRA